MDYFQNREHVHEYIKMAEGFDGKELIEVLNQYLKPGSTVLEIGMGPGKDLDMLSKMYQATGSDHSKIFLELYKRENPDADLLFLDARTLDTDRKFDCIYSNKVLIHLTKDEARGSFKAQKELLNENGILFHSFWKGDREENMDGLHFTYYEMSDLIEMTKHDYSVLKIKEYTEMKERDSLFIILKKKE